MIETRKDKTPKPTKINTIAMIRPRVVCGDIYHHIRLLQQSLSPSKTIKQIF
ncbi:MAG: hypothetical protein Q7T40_01670 [Methylobacter sp.]|nr:hypothetical protein [Methylobacter sp.]